MKKTLIALAALGAMAGVAHAQSSVTLYGVADAFIGQITTKVQAPGVAETKLSQNVVNGSGLSSSRWGLRGSEDLGGGLSAVFNLESGFDLSTGANANPSAQGTTLFGRQANVGLKGAFGTVSLGRQYTAYDALRGVTNNTFDSNTFATTGTVWGVGVQDYQNRASNSIAYASPDFAGISGGFVYGFGENKTAAANAESTASLHIKYANGPLLVGYAHQREKQIAGGNYFGVATIAGAAPAVAVTETRKYNLLGASYDFGVAKLTGSYNDAKNNVRDDKEYQLGVSVPFGAASVAAGYSRAKSEGAGLSTLKGTGYSLLGTYSLSKRTTAYAGVTNTKREAGAAALTTTKVNTTAVGVRHTF